MKIGLGLSLGNIVLEAPALDLIAGRARMKATAHTAAPIIWTPASASPLVWLRADLGITIATGVSVWADQSGNGHDLAQATGSKQPTFRASSGPNSMPCVEGDGSNDFLQATFAWNHPAHLWIVSKTLTLVDDAYVCTGTGDDAPDIRTMSNGDVYARGGAQIGPVAGGGGAGAWHYYEFQHNGASAKLSRDAGSYTTGDSGTKDPGGLTLFAYLNGAGCSNAQIAEVIGFSSIQSAGVIANVQGYLHHRYGL